MFLDREQGMARREHWGKCSSASLSESEGERREHADMKGHKLIELTKNYPPVVKMGQRQENLEPRTKSAIF